MNRYEKPRNCAGCQKPFEYLFRNPFLSPYSRSIQSLDEEIVQNLMVHKSGNKVHDSLQAFNNLYYLLETCQGNSCKYSYQNFLKTTTSIT